MSIFSNSIYKSMTFAKILRSWYFLFALICGVFIFFPMISYAESAEEQRMEETAGSISDNSAIEGAQEPEGERGPQEKTISLEIVHTHLGNENVQGGCYKTQTTKTVRCTGATYDIEYAHVEAPEGYGQNYTTYGVKCSSCGYEKWFGNLAERWHYNNGNRPCCTGTVTTTAYAPSCGMGNQQTVGTLSLTASDTLWTNEVMLTASYEAVDALHISEAPYLWNGTEASSSAVFPVTENGTYTLGLAIPQESNTSVGVLTLEVTNIDHSLPVIEQITYETSADAANVTLTVTASDLQPDGSEGSGLHAQAYSYDGGRTWTGANTYTVYQNSEVAVCVRDAVGNTANALAPVTTIKIEEPQSPPSSEEDTEEILDEELTQENVEVTISENTISNEVIMAQPKKPEVKKKIRSNKSVAYKSDEKRMQAPLKEEKSVLQEKTEETVQAAERKQEKHWDYKDTLAVLSGVLLLGGVGTFVMLLLTRTIAVYCEDADGEMCYQGRQWIYVKEAQYEVKVPKRILEECVTTHFCLCPGLLFVWLHKEKNIACLFGEEAYVLKSVERNIEISLL